MVVERVRLHRAGALSIDAAIALATITAACCDVAHEHHIPCYMLDSRSWKAAATGNGNADKAAAVWTVKALYGIEAVHDAADALLMASVAQRQPELLKEALW
jgi:Holliday junction resolvasome RuvABC endonuclease subunit